MINVLITDDHPIVRRGLKQLLEDDKNQRFGILEEAESGKEMLEKLASLDFDVLLLDISLPRRNGLELLVDIKRIKPKLPVIMLSVYSEEQYAVRVLNLVLPGISIKPVLLMNLSVQFLKSPREADICLHRLRKSWQIMLSMRIKILFMLNYQSVNWKLFRFWHPV